MTDVRIPERWLNDRRLLRLSDPAYRLFITALAWSVSNRTDGVVDQMDLTLLPRVDVGCVEELEKAALWSRVRDTWLIVDFDATQTSAHDLEVLENARRREREKKARQRASKRDCPPGLSPGTVPRDNTGQDRQGQDRQLEEPPTEVSAPEVDTTWADSLFDRER